MGLFSAIVVGGLGYATIYVTGGASLLLVPLGFTSTGIAAGSFAAGAQAYVGNLAAGSVVSQLTSIAMLAPTP